MGFLDDVIIDGAKLDADISDRIQSARSIRSTTGASSIEVGVIDHDHRIRESGLLTRRGKPPKKTDFDQAAWDRFGAVGMTVNGRFYRFVDYSKQPGSDVLLLSWEMEIATLMRGKLGPRKASRADMSRLDFVVQGARRVRSYRINVRAPEADEKQPIRGDTSRHRAKERERGLSKGSRVTVKGVKATREQRENLETILAVADEEKAGELATLALLVAVIQESTVHNLPGGDRDSVGILQLRSMHLGGSTSTNGGRRDIELVTKLFLTKGFWGKGGAIKVATENPDFQPGEVAQQVQGSGVPTGYTPWEEEARTILDAYGGVGRVVVDRKRYEYEVAGPDRETREPAENEWEASGRLLDEVRFNRFATDNTLWLVSDEWLFGREPVFYLEENEHTLIGVPGVGVGRRVDQVKVQARKPVWTGRPGCVAEVPEREGPIAGRWLVESIEEDLLVAGGISTADLVLRRPVRKLAEEAATKTTRLLTESGAPAGSARASIVEMAEEAFGRKSNYRYGPQRPYPRSLFFTGTRPAPRTGAPIPVSGMLEIDCSSFVTLVYKAARAPDPNGMDYNGSGNTSTLRANGKRTNDPQPGDLAHFGPGDPGPTSHVGIYVGDGEMIDMTGSGMHRRKVSGVPGFAGYWQHDLGG